MEIDKYRSELIKILSKILIRKEISDAILHASKKFNYEPAPLAITTITLEVEI